MTSICAHSALSVTRRATRAACLVVSMTALSISQVRGQVSPTTRSCTVGASVTASSKSEPCGISQGNSGYLYPPARAWNKSAIQASAHSIGLGVVSLGTHPALEVPLGSRNFLTPWSPNPAPGTFRKFAVPVFIALQSLDAGATEYGFHQRDWIEHNPTIPHSTAGRMTYFGLTGAGVVLGSAWLERRGHGRLSKVLLVGAIAVEGYAASHSLAGLQR